jgi:hypothetical protein
MGIREGRSESMNAEEKGSSMAIEGERCTVKIQLAVDAERLLTDGRYEDPKPPPSTKF